MKMTRELKGSLVHIELGTYKEKYAAFLQKNHTKTVQLDFKKTESV